MKRQALGKGLSSLIPEPILDRKGEAGLLMVDIDRIRPNRYQPRTDFGGMEGLVASIRENGIVQPVIVRQEEDGYRLIAGERRWRAAQIAGMHKIPAIVRKLADDRLLEVALIENIQRKELNPIEEAKAYEVLLSQMKLSQSEVAKRVGRDRSSISNSLRILKLPDSVQNRLRDGELSLGHAKAIMALPDAETQIRVATDAAERLLSVRETEERVAALLQGSRRPGRAAVTADEGVDPNVRAAADRLCQVLATKVRIVDRGGRGRIEIEYYSDEELQRLYGFLMTAEKGH
ncbi:MAG TPA: ParB/RepB/Spo0J family partition protein [Candidatus Polarisedimenticolia bacterium]|nr:ParB/RepB/Spo0J family partition protein [Candidatus Polarisedimenticolia bacterium]